MTDTATPALDPAAAAVATLRARTTGDVLLPGDDRYDEHCASWNVVNRHRPAVVVAAECTADVVAAVRFAAAEGLGVGVQATGHGVARTADGGVLVVTRRMQDLIVDATARTAWVSAGCTWAPVLEAAQWHGLAPLLGSSPGVGAIGYTLGGGLGWLARRYGPAIDSVRSFEVVTPDGAVVRASADEDAELFFALRGAGAGTLGIVTGMEIDLYPVATVYGGNLLYPVEQAAEVMARFAAWAPGTPDELTSGVVLMNFPPFDEVPEPVRGRSFAILRGCWCGPIEEGRALLDAWRSEMPSALDLWGEMPFSEVAAISADPVEPMPVVGRGAWLRQLDDDVARAMIEATFAADGRPLLAFSEVRHLGGAVARGAGEGAGAMGHRDVEFCYNAIGAAPDPDVEAALRRHQDDLARALAPELAGTYLNFVEGEQRRSAVADAVDAGALARLQAVRAAVDADDRLRFGLAYGG